MTHPDVPAEQAYVDHAYERLAAMRSAAAERLHEAFGETGGTFQAVTERDIRVRNSLGRLEQLELGRESLVFGRIDRHRDGELKGHARPEVFHIGRVAVSDSDQEPLVVDWRAPVAEPFYRATGAHPMNLARRRHLLTEGQRVVDLEDELFDREGSDQGVGLGLSGHQVLLASLERSRTGRMRDIVATVQREQDEIIRGPLAGVLVVQGGPGTGKTAVALHRAAYLLYTHRFPLESQGVLVIGPNPTFLRYIEHVLPSLDENGVELSTVNALYPAVRPTLAEPVEVSRLKGDARMARVIAQAVADRQRPLRRVAEVPYGSSVLRISPELSARVVTAAKRRPGTHNARRRALEAMLWRELLPQVRGADRGEDGGDALTGEELGRSLRRTPEMVEVLERIWPLLSPEQLLRDLFGAAPLIELAAGAVLSGPELRMLLRARGDAPAAAEWSDADVALLDEAHALLGPRRRRQADASSQVRTFGHVVVDEAQDLSPMKLRMVGRRSLSGSMTVVGDIAQATGPWAPALWSQLVEHLPTRRGWRLAELTVNYRTPAEIMDLAGRVLDHVSPGVRPSRAVRATGTAPRILGVPWREGALPEAPLADQVARAVAEELGVLAVNGAAGTIGVIVPRSLRRAVQGALSGAGVRFGGAGRAALDEQVTLLAVEDAKGLEFDSVVVVEPARIEQEATRGLRALYVAFTRATRRLTIVHTGSLPAPLAVAQTPA